MQSEIYKKIKVNETFFINHKEYVEVVYDKKEVSKDLKLIRLNGVYYPHKKVVLLNRVGENFEYV